MVSMNGATPGATVAVDVMGADHGPGEVIKGAVDAHHRGVGVTLVGDPAAIRRGLADAGEELPFVASQEIIGMDEPVVQALRRSDSSLLRATELVGNGNADAAVSCGNSAAIMAISRKVLGQLPGIDRPAFGGFLPAKNSMVFVLDIGANPTVKTIHLLQFAVMGDVYVRLRNGIESPRIGLLSNGSEDSKGTKQIKETNESLRKFDLNFIGNVEGNQVFEGGVDVVVCDGFSGNVLLKSAEGVASEIFELIRAELSKDLLSRLGAALLMPAFGRIRRRVDYQEYGGAPVLGVNGVMVNCHGRSRAKAVTNAIVLAERLARERLPSRIGAALEADEVEIGRARRLARALHLRHEKA